jgi:ElaB/YqjD/DUF883 family membrane-anchored ribosome-binding protein
MRSERLLDGVHSFRDQVHRRWDKLTKHEVENIDLDASSLASALAKRYSLPTKDARQQAEEFIAGLGTSFSEAAHVVGEAASDLWRNGREHVTEAMSQGAEKVTDLWQSARDRMDLLCRRTEKAVVQRPMTSLAIAAGVGALLMIWLRRRWSRA